MKILKCSNYDWEGYPEEFVAEGIKDRAHADAMCGALNDRVDVRGPDYYRVVEDDYVLRRFEP